MSWSCTNVMDERKRFVLRALDPTTCMAELCREFGIARKTGYKWLERFKKNGERGLEDLARRPKRSPSKISAELQLEIIKLRKEHPSWGPKKLRELVRRSSGSQRPPAVSTVARVLAEFGLVEPRRRRKPKKDPNSSERVTAEKPNDLWTVDFKGWWRTRDNKRCEPLTIRDDWSRFLLEVRAMESTRTDSVRRVFEEVFSRYGLPAAIRTDNGSPFACTRSLARLTKLSAWWTALGIRLDTIDPGSPQQNGGHERMHRDLATEVERNPYRDVKSQQSRFDDWRLSFNTDRPHEALNMKTPAELYKLSGRAYGGKTPELLYPPDYDTRIVSKIGRIKVAGNSRYLSEALASWPVGLLLRDGILTIWFADLCLGATDPTFSIPLMEAA